jgi:hypothetical protein
VARRNLEPISRRKLQIRQNLWTPVAEMLHMNGFEEVGIRGRLSPCPDVPTSCVALGRVAQAIDREYAVANVASDAYLEVTRGLDRLYFEARARVFL